MRRCSINGPMDIKEDKEHFTRHQVVECSAAE